MRPSAVLACGPVVVAAGLVACSMDFGRFDPAGDAGGGLTQSEAGADGAASGGGDGGTTTDGGTGPESAPSVDACAGLQACLTQASSCGQACGATSQQCQNDCQSNQCKANCRKTEQSCRSACASTCVSCSTSAGCADTIDCQTAAGP